MLEVTLSSGEAYLRKIGSRSLASRGIGVSITTGRRGMTPERVRMAKAAGVASGSVSLDGSPQLSPSCRSALPAAATFLCTRAAGRQPTEMELGQRECLTEQQRRTSSERWWSAWVR